MSEPLPVQTPEREFCPRGCADSDECRGSIAIPCARNLWDLGETGRFQPCGCLEREKCQRCGVCESCDGCYCGEESDRG